MENEYGEKGQEENWQQEAEGENGNPFADMDDNLCKRCGKKTIDRSENPDSQLCRDCREELIKLRIPPYFYVIGAVVILLMAFTLVTSLGSFDNLGSYSNADGLAGEGYVITAMENLVSVLDENPDNKQAAIKLADIGMKYGYYDYAAYAIDNFLVGKEVSDGQYNKITEYIRLLNIYYDTCDLNDKVWEDIYASAEDEDDIEAILADYNKELSSYLGSRTYDQALLYYYMGYMSLYEEERNSYFEECLRIDPNYFDAYAQIANSCRRNGDLETARKWLEDAYAINKEDYSVLRGFATLELVEGDLEKGLDFASQAFDLYPEGDYVIDTYIIALAANGSIEKARAFVDIYEDTYVFDDDLYDFLDGKMTLEEYYIGE